MQMSRRMTASFLKLSLAVLRRLPRWPLVTTLLAWTFSRMGFALPVERLREDEAFIAFPHPQPAYPLHILIVPKRPVANLLRLADEAPDLLASLIALVEDLVEEFNLGERGYRLIVNGGKYQELPLLHFHLVSGEPQAGSRGASKG